MPPQLELSPPVQISLKLHALPSLHGVPAALPVTEHCVARPELVQIFTPEFVQPPEPWLQLELKSVKLSSAPNWQLLSKPSQSSAFFVTVGIPELYRAATWVELSA